jgi:hypothetical protein
MPKKTPKKRSSWANGFIRKRKKKPVEKSPKAEVAAAPKPSDAKSDLIHKTLEKVIPSIFCFPGLF